MARTAKRGRPGAGRREAIQWRPPATPERRAPCRLTALQAAARIASGRLKAETLVRSCLERIEAREADVGAWAYLDPAHALDQARRCDGRGARGVLRGVPVGFKDIVDTADMPTACGSPIYRDNRPMADAACVALTRQAGGIVLGKTVTTEFAGRFPGKTSNPHHRGHTPGGSSSGSAAAVADFMVPLAIGSQTAGSVIRPASYCGVHALKPTYGTISFAGVKHLGESSDTLGMMARSIDDLALFRSVLLGEPRVRGVRAPGRAPAIGFCRTPWWDEADAATRDALEAAARRLSRAGARLSDMDLPAEFADVARNSWWIIRWEMARILAPEYAADAERLSTVSRQMIEAGRAMSHADYVRAVTAVGRLRHRMHAAMDGFDAVLTPSAVGEAPRGLADTGPVTFNVLWQFMHLPCVNLPAFTGAAGLPIGAQLVARRFEDAKLLSVAKWVEPRLA